MPLDQFPERNSDSICCIIGLGYIGLPSAVVIAEAGFSVCGVDINPDVVSTLNNGSVHILEPGLDVAFSRAHLSGTFRAQSHPEPADTFIIAVPTPFDAVAEGLPRPNIDFVLSATRAIAPLLQPGNLVILESTSPVGTTDAIADLLFETTGFSSEELFVAYCPERVLPGRILHELITNDRVIGGINPSSAQAAKTFYSSFCTGSLLTTTSSTAEMVKLAENSYRDVNIAFANELSLACDRLDVNVRHMIRLANHHPRVNILQPGSGVGGHCIAVDPWFIASQVPDCTPLIQTARRVNDHKRDWVVEQIKLRTAAIAESLDRPPKVGCLGLAFKPDVDDLRESPAFYITSQLLNACVHVLACEPNLSSHPSIKLYSLDEVLAEADLLVFLVAHSQFRHLDLTGRVVYDPCGVTEQT